MGPLTHAHTGDIVVFNVGMTVRKPHRPGLWMPVAIAMQRMLGELTKNKAAAERGEAEDLGYLGGHRLMGAKGPWSVQYWRSVEQLYAYAKHPDTVHLPAWRAFNQAAREHPDAVGIWHETYVVPASGIETFYAHGALVGLGAATGTIPAERRGRTASERLASGAANETPAV